MVEIIVSPFFKEIIEFPISIGSSTEETEASSIVPRNAIMVVSFTVTQTVSGSFGCFNSAVILTVFLLLLIVPPKKTKKAESLLTTLAGKSSSFDVIFSNLIKAVSTFINAVSFVALWLLPLAGLNTRLMSVLLSTPGRLI
ncbi:MAG: hypothetical protein LBO71_02740 [Prevotellaceae bacterium]|nr:hypothetical protein [Prevotellaceae bacterium]